MSENHYLYAFWDPVIAAEQEKSFLEFTAMKGTFMEEKPLKTTPLSKPKSGTAKMVSDVYSFKQIMRCLSGSGQ